MNIGMPDVSALGAAYIAGLKAGVFKDLNHLKSLNSDKTIIHPEFKNDRVKIWYQGWKAAIA